jgi:hypothetical protein
MSDNPSQSPDWIYDEGRSQQASHDPLRAPRDQTD